MPNTQLIINVGGSALCAELDDLQPWRALLSNADSIALQHNGAVRVRVELSGLKRWIAFNRIVNGSPLRCIGWQETVGAIYRNNAIIGGSNRKVLAWLHPSGRVEIE